jgi:hypothetical protein
MTNPKGKDSVVPIKSHIFWSSINELWITIMRKNAMTLPCPCKPKQQTVKKGKSNPKKLRISPTT